MNIKSIGQTLKTAALFTIGSELTKKGIEKAKEKWNELKEKKAAKSEHDEHTAQKEKLGEE